MKDLLVSCAPHLHSGEDIPWMMRQVMVALVPAIVFGIYFFGLPALRVMCLSVAACLASEALAQKIMRRPITLRDGSAALTGLLLALNLPAGAPWWLVVIGAGVAIVIGKQIFGGLGYNPFNPALVARVFLLISFPVAMTTWPVPRPCFWERVDTVSGATPLGALKMAMMQHQGLSGQVDLLDPFLGNVGGSLGEISALALLIGGAYLLARRIITWHIPVIYCGTVAALTGLWWAIDPATYAGPVFHLVTGGLMLGAFFMATDPVTSPITNAGKCIFALGCGVITVVIRLWGGYPEGVSFAVLIMNAVVPLINRVTQPRIFGAAR